MVKYSLLSSRGRLSMPPRSGGISLKTKSTAFSALSAPYALRARFRTSANQDSGMRAPACVARRIYAWHMPGRNP